jgi:hypothetical protein
VAAAGQVDRLEDPREARRAFDRIQPRVAKHRGLNPVLLHEALDVVQRAVVFAQRDVGEGFRDSACHVAAFQLGQERHDPIRSSA